jgi:hypothetical protein
VVLDLGRLMFNGTKAWKGYLHRAYDSDCLLASLSATVRSILNSIGGDLVDILIACKVPPRRSAADLTSQGYSRVLTKHDPFTPSELEAVQAALHRYVHDWG